MCVRCHLCVWRRRQAKVPTSDSQWEAQVPTSDMHWDHHFNARTPTEFSTVSVRTPDPAVVLHHVHGDGEGKGLPSNAKTPLQTGDSHQKSVEIIVNELKQKLQSLQLHQGMNVKEVPSTRDGSGPEASCRTPETEGIVATAQLPAPVKLPVPSLPQDSTASENQTVPSLSTSAEDMQDEGVVPPPPLPVWAEEQRGLCKSPIIIPQGSLDHSYHCGCNCKYACREGSCTNDQACLNCDQCSWLHDCWTAVPDLVTSFSALDALTFGVPMPQLWNASTEPWVSYPWPSIGSVGHPHSCAGLGCKYSNKARGCKDGQLCTRCHLCHWSRYDKPVGRA